MLVDSHRHLDFPDFAEERDAIIARAGEAGVGLMVSICTRVRKIEQIRTISERYPSVFHSVGTHPHNAGYGRSLKHGIREAKHDTICITDADLTYPAEAIPGLLKEFQRGNDMVVGQRTGSTS